LGGALGKSPVLLPMPGWVLQVEVTIAGKKEIFHRLCSSIEVEISKTYTLLDWTPPYNVDKAHRRVARHFFSEAEISSIAVLGLFRRLDWTELF